ncbi:MAG: YXWGXW repeat-containing protein [Gammaproteobacteria bacterium]
MKRLLVVIFVSAILGAPLLVVPAPASAQVSVGISVQVGPPPLPMYPQPFTPGPGYLWTPGYWAWGAFGYYWVPGAWVMAPAIGLLWTPGYWAWNGGMYWWRPGYWGARVGFYGGINYGYGYIGVGYVGGYWRSGAFYYNRAVSNVNVSYIHNTYNRTVVHNVTVNRVSYNGGAGGTTAQASAEQLSYAREQHVAPTSAQVRQQHVAMNNPAQRFTRNQGRPQVAATARPGVFTGPGAVRMTAKGSYAYRPAPRDRAAYQQSQREDESRAMPAQPRREGPPGQAEVQRGPNESRPQTRERKANRKRPRCRPSDPRCR